jgi:hypothetical protein
VEPRPQRVGDPLYDRRHHRSHEPDSASGGGGQGGTGGQGAGGGQSGGTGTPGSGSGTPRTNGAAPSIRGLKLSTSTVWVDTHGYLVLAARGGLSITYTEANTARLTVTLLRAENGIRRGARCVTPTARTRRLKRCTHFVVLRRLTHNDRAGRTTLRLDQLLRGRLRPGTYRFDMTPRANGKAGKTVSVLFVVRRSRHR